MIISPPSFIVHLSTSPGHCKILIFSLEASFYVVKLKSTTYECWFEAAFTDYIYSYISVEQIAVFLYLTNMFNAHNRLQIILFIFLRTFKDQKIFSALLLFAVGNMKGFIYACSYVCVT